VLRAIQRLGQGGVFVPASSFDLRLDDKQAGCQVGSFKLGAAESGSVQPGPLQIRLAQVGSPQIRPPDFEPPQVCPSKIDRRPRMLGPPPVPAGDRLEKAGKLLVVCHASRSLAMLCSTSICRFESSGSTNCYRR